MFVALFGNALASTIDLYTGQHSESFPLAGLKGFGGIHANVTLSYNGNVRSIAKEKNYAVQASCAGLGFSIKRQMIIADHKGTASLADDNYILNFNGRVDNLIKLSADTFVTTQGTPWKIYRQVNDTITDVPIITGWTIISDDGTYYRFGDFNDTTLVDFNATWNTFRYGSHIGVGMTNDEESYPFRWDLRMIHDPDTLHWVKFNYTLETSNLKVYDSGDTIVNSSPYVRSSYIDQIQYSDGRKISLEYSNRSDYGTFAEAHSFEYYMTKKLDKIEIKDSNNTVQSVMNLDYDYLDSHSDAAYHKLLLRSILRTNDDETDTLSITRFSYYTSTSDIAYGSIREIYYPSGSSRQYHYTTISDDDNLTDLDTCLHDPMEAPSNYELYNAERLFFSNQGDSAKIGIWDGYWQIDTTGLTSSDIIKHTPAVSPDGWIAYYQRSLDNVVVKMWNGGFWKTYSLEVPDDIGTNDVDLYPGKNSFLMIVKNSASYNNGDTTESKETAENTCFYKYDEAQDTWTMQELISPNSNMKFIHDVQVNENMFTIAVHEDATGMVDGMIYYGCFDNASDSVVYDSVSIESWWMYGPEVGQYTDVATGNHFFAYVKYDEVNCYNWDGNSWEHYSLDTFGSCYAIGLHENGFTWSDFWQANPSITTLNTAFFSADSVFVISKELPYVWNLPRNIQQTSHSLAFLSDYFGDAIDFESWRYEWDDTSWSLIDIYALYQVDTGSYEWAPMDTKYQRLYENSYFIVARDIDSITNFRVISSRYNPDSEWGGLDTLLFSHSQTAPSVSEDYCLYLDTLGDNIRIKYYDDFQYSYGYSDIVFLEDSSYYGFGNSLIANQSSAYIYYYNSYDGEITQRAFAKIDNKFQGKVPLIVVDTVYYYEHLDEPNPVVEHFSYFGGRSSFSGLTPQFSKVKKSTPFFESDSPEGYTVKYFFNDFSEYGMIDGHYSDSVYSPGFNDTCDTGESVYNYENGGYLLNGMQYLSYRCSADSNTTENVNYVKSKYKFEHTSDSLIFDNLYRQVLASEERRSDNFIREFEYNYNKLNGKLNTIRTKRNNGDSIIVDYLFAFEDTVNPDRADSILNDNAIGLYQETKTSFFDSSSVSTSTLSKNRRDFYKKGMWDIADSYTWTDLTNLQDAVFKYRVCDVDNYGNVTGFVNVYEDTIRIKYKPSTNYRVASGVGLTQDDLTVMDFEYGEDWDNWNLNDSEIDTNETSAFTGSCYGKITSTTADVYGPTKTISSSSISDSLYYTSAWIKTTGQAKIFLYAYYNGGVGIDSAYFNAPTVGQMSDWSRVELVSNINELAIGNEVTSIQFWVMAEGGIASPNIVCVDNIRLHPLGSHVTTQVFDDRNNVSSKLGLNNIPVNYEYDSFDRLLTVKNFGGDVIEEYQYNYADVWNYNSVGLINMDSSTTGTIDSTIVLTVDQTISYSLELLCENTSLGASVYILSTLNGVDTNIDSIVCTQACSFTNVTGSYRGDKGDTLKLQIIKPSEATGSWTLDASITCDEYIYDPDKPENVVKHSYHENNDTVTTIEYFDSHGNLIQQRQTNYIDSAGTSIEATKVIVGPEYDAMNKVTKSYKPYYDLVGSKEVADFTTSSNILTELNNYYDGSNAVDCDSRPYVELDYYDDVSNRINQISQPGDAVNWGIDSGHTVQYLYSFDDTNELNTVQVTDPDNNSLFKIYDSEGMYSKDSTTHTVKNSLDQDSTAFIVKTTVKNIKGQVETITLQDGVDSVTLREYEYDDLGRVTREWRNDFGTIRAFYNLAGDLRFRQTDKDSINNNFVYYKYDLYGRLIEEGLCAVAINGDSVFNTSYAQDNSFPHDSLIAAGKIVKFQYSYDYLDVDSVYVTYGALLKAESGESIYSREYYCDLIEKKDSVVVQLPMVSADKKSIVHSYDNISGRINQLQMFPFESTSGARVYDYEYLESGMLQSVREGHLSGSYDYTRDFITYDYYADGSIDFSKLGAYDSLTIDQFSSQVLNYSYNPQGLLTAINDPQSLASDMSGFCEDSIHFGMNLHYSDNPTGANSYYNGLVSRVSSAHSSDTGKITQTFDYTYNELGWLTRADHNADGSASTIFDRAFEYNFLGNRMAKTIGPSSMTYEYESSTSSKLINANSGYFQDRSYDAVGNMISNPNGGVGTQYYEYRDLLNKAVIQPSVLGADSSTVEFWYDELMQRIRKKYSYTYVIGCDTATDTVGGGGGIELLSMGPMGPGGGGQICYNWGIEEEFYLYDGRALLAVFDRNDNVTHSYVNSPTGKVAVFKDNDDSQRYYFMKDQIGNTRVVVDDTGSVVQYIDYHPFGGVAKAWSSFNSKFNFTGKERDQLGAFSLDYFGARYYEPGTGRFTTIDKMGQMADGYNYCNNNPVSNIDPDGNWWLYLFTTKETIQDGDHSYELQTFWYLWVDDIIDDVVGSEKPRNWINDYSNTGPGGGNPGGGGSGSGSGSDGSGGGQGGGAVIPPDDEEEEDPQEPPEDPSDSESLIDEAMKQEPLDSDSPECDEYGDEEYIIWDLQCVCECAGDSDWSNTVRSCINYMDENGASMFDAHVQCYIRASEIHDIPIWDVVFCGSACTTSEGAILRDALIQYMVRTIF